MDDLLDPEMTVRPKKNTAIKRIQTFAAADGLRYTPNPNRSKKGPRAYTVPLFPPLSSSVEVLNAHKDDDVDLDNDHRQTKINQSYDEKKRAALSRDQLTNLYPQSPISDHRQQSSLLFSPRSASSGFGGSSGLAWSEASFLHTSVTSPDSAISLFSGSTPSKYGSLVAKKRRSQFDLLPEEYSIHRDHPHHHDLVDEEDFDVAIGDRQLQLRGQPRVDQTTYVTSVFEILGRGMHEIVDWIDLELRHFYDQGLMIVYCDMRWSTPDKYRDIEAETQVKSRLLDGLRTNNTRVWDSVEDLSITSKPPRSTIDEIVTRKWNWTGGAYRRYYGGLATAGHKETALEHAPWWCPDSHVTLDETIDWPVIGPRNSVSVLMLNMICLRMHNTLI